MFWILGNVLDPGKCFWIVGHVWGAYVNKELLRVLKHFGQRYCSAPAWV